MHSRALEREGAHEGEGELMRERERVHVRGRGRVSCEGERKGEIPILMIVWPRGQKLHELGTPCPEYPGKFPEYPGCYNGILFPVRTLKLKIALIAT